MHLGAFGVHLCARIDPYPRAVAGSQVSWVSYCLRRGVGPSGGRKDMRCFGPGTVHPDFPGGHRGRSLAMTIRSRERQGS